MSRPLDWGRLSVLVLILACKGQDGSDGTKVTIAEFAGLTEGAAWTWRDDLGNDEIDDERLLRAHHTGDGFIEIRRGARWADAGVVGSLSFSDDGGLFLTSWDFGADEGEGDLQLGATLVGDNDIGSGQGWSCFADIDAEVETFYGTFADAVVFDCTQSSAGLAGTYSFARDVGLVKLVANSGVAVDLVAPY